MQLEFLVSRHVFTSIPRMTRDCAVKFNCWSLLCPSMGAILICAHIIQPHFFFSASGLCLKENSFRMTALGTSMILCTGQRGIRDHVRNDVCELTGRRRRWRQRAISEVDHEDELFQNSEIIHENVADNGSKGISSYSFSLEIIKETSRHGF